MNINPIERLVSGSFIAAAMAIALVGGSVWRIEAMHDDAISQEIRTHRVLTLAGEIMLNLTRAETAQRGYAVYGSKDYQRSRDKSFHDVAQSVSETERLVVAPEQHEYLRQIKLLVAKRTETFLQNAGYRKTNKRAVADELGSPSLVSQIHPAVGRIVKIENARLLESEAGNAYRRKVEHLSFAMLGVFLSLLLMIQFLRIRRAMRLIHDEGNSMRIRSARLEETVQVKSEFLANMSHEIRTPINAIVGFSELLRDGRLGKLTKAQAEYISDIFDSGQYLRALVNNILDLSKIEAGKMALDLEPVDISELIGSSIYVIKEKIASQRIRLHLDVQPGLVGIQVNAFKVKQILFNLLSNAVRFTPDGGQLKLCARRVPRSEIGPLSGGWPSRVFPLADNGFMEFLEISVADNGCGIPRGGLERLFQQYSRIDSEAVQKSEGTGLGLMLVKQLAELHGGTVAVESSEGHGSRFIVWLPLRADAGEVAAPAKPMPHEFLSEAIGALHKICIRTVREMLRQRTFVRP